MNKFGPHDILDEQLFRLFPRHELMKKENKDFEQKIFILVLFSQLIWNIKCFIKIKNAKNAKFIFREFDKFSIIHLLFSRPELIFNVNHNLQGALNKFVCSLLASKHSIVMLDAPQEMKNRFKYLKSLPSPIQAAHPQFNLTPNVLIIVGNRLEQRTPIHDKVDEIVKLLKNRGYTNITIAGKLNQSGMHVSQERFEELVSNSLTINLVSYTDRHSGTIWFLKHRSPRFLQWYSNVASEQVKNADNATIFFNYQELLNLLNRS